ncbi:MAG: ABC transporter substrate-binding protein [Halanaerobiales bacterium]|nr:ABC transporter substrate-binding protein [Halanaerobiales bacterium]
MVSSKKNIIVCLILLLMVSTISGLVFADQKVTLVDYDGVEVQINAPVQRIVCISSALNEILCVLNAGDKIVGRDSKSVFPPILADVTVVARSSAKPQIEAVLELDPDVIIADTMLKDDVRKKFEAFGVPVIVERGSDPERLFQVIRNLALIVENQECGEKLVSFISSYENLIKERLAGLSDEEKVRVYWEWNKPYKTGSAGASCTPRIIFTGGKNICHDAEGKYPVVSSEYIWERNPEVIVKMASRGDSLEIMKQTFEEIMTRQGLKETDAVKNNNVHVISWEIHNGLRSVIGSLYYAKWLHPEKFEDIDPEQIHKKLLKDFYGFESSNPVVY